VLEDCHLICGQKVWLANGSDFVEKISGAVIELELIATTITLLTVDDFINVLRARFSYKSAFFAKT
jgi:hypothetical protein